MNEKIVKEGDLLWASSEEKKASSRMKASMAWLKEHKGLELKSYEDLWQWSVSHIPQFWESIWQYFDVQASRPYSAVLQGNMPGAQWFKGAELNYAEHVFRSASSDRPAPLSCSETRDVKPMFWAELHRQVSSLAALSERFLMPDNESFTIDEFPDRCGSVPV